MPRKHPTYEEKRSIAPHILKLDITCSSVVNFKPWLMLPPVLTEQEAFSYQTKKNRDGQIKTI